MKISIKKKLATVVLSGTMLASGLATAGCIDLDPKVYMGAEVNGSQYNSVKDIQLGSNRTDIRTINRTDGKSILGNRGAGLSGFIGTRLNQYFGLEAGYSIMSKPKGKLTNLVNLNNATNVKTNISNAYVDAIGFIPVTDQLEAMASVGLGFLTTKVSANVSGRAGTAVDGHSLSFAARSTNPGVRLGAGLGYKLDENITARLMLRHQQGNKLVKSVNSVGLGLSYQF